MGARGCFACGPDNPCGLHLVFGGEAGEVTASLVLDERYAGWASIAHGGITATLLDEAASYVPHSMGLVTVTARLEVRYSRPVPIGQPLSLRGHFVARRRSVVEATSELKTEAGELLAFARAKLMVLGDLTGDEEDVRPLMGKGAVSERGETPAG